MTYTPSEAERTVTECEAAIEAQMGPEFATKLSDAHCREITEYQDRAVRQHGRQILAAIEGTTFASEGSRSMADESESLLVQLIDSGPLDLRPLVGRIDAVIDQLVDARLHGTTAVPA
jgi:hypothetical protein